MPRPPSSIRISSKRTLTIAVVVMFIVGALGYIIAISRAGGFFSSIDPARGTLSGPVKIISDGSGGDAIQFGSDVQVPAKSPISYGRFLYTTDSVNTFQTQASRWSWHSLQGNHTALLKGIKAINKDVKVTVYATPAAARATDPDGYTTTIPSHLALLDHPDWILKDTSGNQIRRASNDDYALDLGNIDYQKASLDFLVAKLIQDGWDGVVLDEINPNPLYSFPDKRPAKYPDDNSWRNVTYAYVKYICDGIHQRGKACYINLGANDDWAKSVAKLTDGAEVEFFIAMDPTYSNGQEVATIENNRWKQQVAWAEWMESNLSQPLFHAATTKPHLADFALGSYLLISQGRAVFASSLNYGNEGNIYTATMDNAKKLGAPTTGRIEEQNGMWRRDFQNGQVLVNPHITSRTYNTHTLAPTSAQVILK